MQFDWRAISGPALTTATALIAILVDRTFVAVPNPAPLFVCIVAFAASLSGIASGHDQRGIAVAASAVFFLNHRAAPGYDASDLARMVLLALTAAATAVITGLLRQKWVDAFAAQRRHYATGERLKAALDQIDIGIVLLDADTCAEFINRAFRLFLAFQHEGRLEAAPHRADVSRSRYRRPRPAGRRVERLHRLAHRDDTLGQFDADQSLLRDGQVLRISCTALPDGGRMLSYTPVTDLVRHGDDPSNADYFRSLRGGGDHGLAPRCAPPNSADPASPPNAIDPCRPCR